MNAMGHWPSFHDSHVLSAAVEGDICRVTVFVFLMTDRVNDRGCFVLTNHHKVYFEMSGVTECSLGPTGDTILDELRVESAGEFQRVDFSSAIDPEEDWHVLCSKVRVTDVEPCGSRSELGI